MAMLEITNNLNKDKFNITPLFVPILPEGPYWPERTASLLANPVLTHCSGSVVSDARKFFGGTLMSDERTVVEMTLSDRVYTGRWYGQGNEVTCAPWSLVNACSVADIELDPGYVAMILNLAYKNGLKLSILADTTKITGVNMKNLPPSATIQCLYDPAYELINRVLLKMNARLIKSLIDQIHPLILNVKAELFYSIPDSTKSETHAICISGYYITEEGYFNVQAIDSNCGIVWMSLEHLSKTVLPERTYKISKLNNQNIVS